MRVETLLSAALACLALGACGPGSEVAGDAVRGKELYAMYGCAACHGAQGRGDGPAAMHLRPRDFRDLGSPGADRTPEGISVTIATGRGAMPAFPYIPPGERRDLAEYVLSLSQKGSKS